MDEKEQEKAPTEEPTQRVVRMGNRLLVGKIPVKYLDWIILIVSITLIGLFVYFIIGK